MFEHITYIHVLKVVLIDMLICLLFVYLWRKSEVRDKVDLSLLMKFLKE